MIDTARVRAKLRDIARKRAELEEALENISDSIGPGMEYIDAHLELLTRPYELYRYASDQTRRMLNQAIFKHVYVLNEEVTGDELNTPMRELLATQRGWVALEETGDAGLARELAVAEAGRRGGVGAVTITQATVAGGLLDEFLGALLLPEGPQEGQSCSRALMVRVQGL